MLAAVYIIGATIGYYPIVERHASLNKFYDGLAAGKCVLLSYHGPQGRLLEDNDAGFGCRLCNIDEFVEKVLYLNSYREELLQTGRNARRVAEEKFDRDKLAAQALSVLEATLN